MDREHFCHTCKIIRNPNALDICKELGHDIDEGDDFKNILTREEAGLEKVSKPKNKVPEIEKIVKGKFGDTFVESIYMDGKPHFLANINGEIKFSERFELDGKTIEPITEQDTPYKPYEFSKLELDLLKNNPPTKEELLEKIETYVKKYIDTTENNRTVIQLDTFLTYFQDQIDTVHYLFVVGDTESGKSTIGYLIKNLGYRVLFQTDLNYAGIYNFYGTREESTGTIIEDEAQSLAANKDKIRLYKGSYSRGSKIAIVVGKDTANQKHQVHYMTFGFKVFIGEEIPIDKGFRERLLVLRMNTGFPDANIKRLTVEEQEELSSLRNALLFYKVNNIREQLPQVKTGLTNRDEELFADLIRISANTKYEEQSRKVVKKYTKERQDAIHNSLESKLLETFILQMDEKGLVEFEEWWRFFTNEQDLIPGTLDKQTFESYEFGKITRQRITPILVDKFQAKKDVTFRDKKKITKYIFNPKVLIKFVKKYDISLPVNHRLHQVAPTSKGDKDEL